MCMKFGYSQTCFYHLLSVSFNFLFFFFLFSFWLCHVARRILVSRPGIEPAHPLPWERGVLTTGPPGKSPVSSNFHVMRKEKRENFFF